MFGAIISYFFIAVVVFAITRDKDASFKWPITFIKFLIDLFSSVFRKR
jgi:hypothetical protein